MGARNWCVAEELPYSEQLQPRDGDREALRQQKTSGALLYTLRVEDSANQTAQPKAYEAICPLYIHSPLSESAPFPNMLAVPYNCNFACCFAQECCSMNTAAWACVAWVPCFPRAATWSSLWMR